MGNEIIRRRDELTKPPCDSYVERISSVRRLQNDKPQTDDHRADLKLTDATTVLESQPGRIEDDFKNLGEQARLEQQNYKGFKFNQGGINREANIPDPIKTLIFVFMFLVGESVLAGVIYSLEDKMGFEEGLGYGAVFSFVNLGCALVIGWALRYLHVTYDDHIPPATIRRWAWLVIACLTSLLGILILSASRARGLARPNDLWNLQELSLGATFSDAYTLIFLALAVIASLFAMWKAATGFSDPIPGFSDAQNRFNEIGDLGEDAAHNHKLSAHETRDGALNNYEYARTDPAEIEDYKAHCATELELCARHNMDVYESQVALQDLRQEVGDFKPHLATFSTDLKHLVIDLQEVEEKLALPAPVSNSDDLIARLETAHQLVIAACDTALITDLNTSQSQEVTTYD